MIGEIDLRKAYDVLPRLYLCNPNRTTIAELKEAYNINIKPTLAGIHELSFTLPYVIPQKNNMIRNPHVDLLKGHYLIRYERGTDKGYFIITKPKKNMGTDGKETLSVTCYLQPYELRGKIIRSYTGTKKLYDATTKDGVLNETLMQKSDWTVGHIDDSLASKYRTFNVSQKSLIDFMNEIADTFDAVIVWDSINKTINFYETANIGTDKGLSIECGKYLKSLDEDPNFDQVVTRLFAYGQNGITISSVNPSGSEYIEMFDYYMYPFQRDANKNVIQSSNYWSDGLCQAQLDYQALLASKQNDFTNLLTQLTNYQTTLTSQQNTLTQYTTDLAVIQDNLNTANATGQPTDQLITQRTAKQAQIDSQNALIATTQASITNVNNQISALRSVISVENNFTPAQIIERNYFIIEQVWSDTNYTDVHDLYNQAVKNLQKLSQPLVQYSIDLVDFTKVVQCQSDWGKLNLGDIVTIKYPNFGINIKAKIITIDQSFDGNSIKLTIANNTDLKSGFYQLKDLLNHAAYSSTTLDMSQYKWDTSSTLSSTINDIINNTYDANKRKIIGATNETVELSNRGLLIKSSTDPNTYLVGTNGVLGITKDGGNTFKSAITADGIVAPMIYGELGAFATVRADKIVLGDNNAGIPSSVLTVGGTNLISKSMYLSTVTNGMTNSKSGFGFKIPQGQTNITFNIGQLNLNKNTDYMISFVAWSPTTPIQAHVQLSPTNNLPIYPFATTTTPTKITWKVNSSSADIGNCQLQFYSDGSDDVYITDIKVEQGTVATDWSPSPNDSVGVGTAYNGVQIDPTNGLVITKSDNTVKTKLNATDGFRIQKNVSGTWTDQFYVDTNGNVQYAGALTSTSQMVDRSLAALLSNVDGFGNGSDGIFNSTGNVTLSVASEDSASVIRMYQSFTLNYNHTLTVDKRCRGLFIFVQGDCTINGTIDMSGKAAKVSKAQSQQRILQIPIGTQSIDIPSGGRSGDGGKGGDYPGAVGNRTDVDDNPMGFGGLGASGTDGTWFGGSIGGASGGGGSYGYYPSLPTGKDNGGDAGSSNLDAPMGTGSGQNYCGGYGAPSPVYQNPSDSYPGGSGAGFVAGSAGSVNGNSGESGLGLGGGLCVIVCKGTVTINGTINCNGLRGGNGGNGTYSSTQNKTGCGGGGQGGGSAGVIVIAWRNGFYNYGNLSVNGGRGGLGGSGSSNGQNGTDGQIGSIITTKV